VSITARDRKVLLILLPVMLLAAFWFLVLSPKRAEVTKADKAVAEQQAKLDDANARLTQLKAVEGSFQTEYASVVRLGKAIPSSLGMPSRLVQLDSAAKGTGIKFDSITAGERTAAAPATAAPAAPAGNAAAGGETAKTGVGKAAETAGNAVNTQNQSSEKSGGLDTKTLREGEQRQHQGQRPAHHDRWPGPEAHRLRRQADRRDADHGLPRPEGPGGDGRGHAGGAGRDPGRLQQPVHADGGARLQRLSQAPGGGGHPMKTFLLDLLEDLREKRLLPVAIALAVGIVAVPVVLAKGSSSEDPAPGAAAKSSAGSQATAAQRRIADLVQSGEGKGTDLNKFGSKDPFKPPSGYSKPPSLADAGDATDAAADAPEPSGGGGTTDTPSTGGNSNGNSNRPSTGGQRKTVAYTYVADVSFAHNGKVRQRKLGRLAMLPSSSNPLLLFLGVTADGDNAVFLVDSSLKAVGEGKCTPSREQCANVYIGAGAEEEFTNADGESYTLRVDEIRKVTVSSQARAAKAARRRAAKARKSSTGSAAARRFVPPILVDLIESSSSSTEGGR
jgi:hypothetical protein